MTIVEPDAEARKRKLDEWREAFDIQDSTIDRVEYFLRSRYVLAPGDKRAALWDHLRFIGNNKYRMRYDARAVVARSRAACGRAREAPHVGVGVREPPVLQSGREVWS